MGHSELAEFLPRLLLAFGSAHFGLFIDLENALCAVATSLAGTSMLTNVIAGIFQGNLLGEGLLVVVLAVVLGVMVLGGADGRAPGTAVGPAGARRTGAGNLFGVGGTLATLLASVAMLYLVLRVPGIVHRHAFRPMMDALAAVAGGAAGFAADVAPRLLALL